MEETFVDTRSCQARSRERRVSLMAECARFKSAGVCGEILYEDLRSAIGQVRSRRILWIPSEAVWGKQGHAECQGDEESYQGAQACRHPYAS